MTIARRLILDRIKVALEGIDGTGVYVSTVDTVHRHARTWNETRFDDRISVCIAPRLETYRYQPANMLRVEFIVDLLAFVNAATDSEDARINAINDLLDDMIAAVHANQTWRGASNTDQQAIATSIVEAETDEADFEGQETIRLSIKVIYDRTIGVTA